MTGMNITKLGAKILKVLMVVLVLLLSWGLNLKRKWELAAGGAEAKCKWDGHDVDDPDFGTIYHYEICDRCGNGVQVK